MNIVSRDLIIFLIHVKSLSLILNMIEFNHANL